MPSAILFLTCTLFLSFYTHASQIPHWIQLRANDKYQRGAIADQGYAIEKVFEDSVLVLGTEQDKAHFEKQGQLIFSRPADLQSLDFPGRDSKFHNFDELTQELNKLAQENPDIVKLSDIGESLEGRKIHHLIITENPDSQTLKPAVAFLGGHHAREHLSVELPLQLIQTLIKKYRERDERVTTLLKSRTFHIIPLVNPDGAEYDISQNTYQYWRKNRRDFSSARGVDLNRNYDFQWGTTGTSDRPSSDVYHGPEPFSESETQAVKRFVEANDNISILVSFHTFSELILYPWGHTYDEIANAKDLQVHETMARTMAQWNNYRPMQSSELYPASGDTTDWTYGVHGIFSFTFELDPKSSWDGGFYPGQSYIEPVFQKNWLPCLYLAEMADNPYQVLNRSEAKYGLPEYLIEE